MNIPVPVIEVIKKLHSAGFEAYLAGGCVRDMLWRLEPNDYDVATSALTEQIEELFAKTVSVGKAFGVIIVRNKGMDIECATFRKDGVYSDSRRPDSIEFCNAEGDSKRRDFKFNALFYDIRNAEVLDFVGGENDIQNRVLNFVGDPVARIKEDPLRILRAIRFITKYGLDCNDDTSNSIYEYAPLLLNISKERVADEVTKIISCRNGDEGFHLLYLYKIWNLIIPEVMDLYDSEYATQDEIWHPEGCVGNHTCFMLSDLQGLSQDDAAKLAWAIVFHDIGKPHTFKIIDGRITNRGHAQVGAKLAEKYLRELKFSNDFIDDVVSMVDYHMNWHQHKTWKLSTTKRAFSRQTILLDLQLNYRDCKYSSGHTDNWQLLFDKFMNMPQESIKPKPFISGQDLIDFGLKPNPSFSKIIKYFYELQLSEEIKTKEEALARLPETLLF